MGFYAFQSLCHAPYPLSCRMPRQDSIGRTMRTIRAGCKSNKPFTIYVLCFSFKKPGESMAERGGFEPPVELLTLQRFSKPPPSATRPSLRVSNGLYRKLRIRCAEAERRTGWAIL